MTNALIGWENHITGATLTADSAAGSLPAENLQNDSGSPAEAWQTGTGVTAASLLIDTGSLDSEWRAFLLARTNLTTAATVRWRVGDPAGFIEVPPLFELPYAPGMTPPPGYHFSRASTASYFDASGVLRQAPVDTLRLTYDPDTLEFQGALKEESRTNLIRRSADISNAVWTKFGAPVVTANVAVAPDGTVTAASVSLSTVQGVYQQNSATGGATYTCSIWLRSDVPITIRQVVTDAVGAPVVALRAVTARWQRFALTMTVAPTSTAIGLQFDGAGGGGKVYAWGGQTELGASASSYIPTTTAAVTRASDSEYVDGLALDGAVGFTVFADWTAEADGSTLIAWSLTPASAAFADSYYVQQLTLSANLNMLDSVHGNWVSRGLSVVAGQRNRVAAMMSLPVGSQVFAAYPVPPPPGGPAGGSPPINGPGLPGVYVRLGCASGSWGTGAPNTSGVQTWRRLAVYGPLYYPVVGALAYYGSTILPQFCTYDSGTAPAGVEPGFGQSVTAAPAPAVGRYCFLEISDPANPDGFLNVPLAFAGPAWQPTGNVSPATVQGRDDATAEFTSRGGQEYPVSFWQRRRADVDFQAIRNSEVWPNVDALDRAARIGGNCLFVPDPDSDDRHRAAVFGRAKPRADLSYYQGAPDRRAWRVSFTERL